MCPDDTNFSSKFGLRYWTTCLQTNQWSVKIRHFLYREFNCKVKYVGLGFDGNYKWFYKLVLIGYCVPKIMNIGLKYLHNTVVHNLASWWLQLANVDIRRLLLLFNHLRTVLTDALLSDMCHVCTLWVCCSLWQQSASGGFAPWSPDQGLCPWTTLVALPQTPGSRSMRSPQKCAVEILSYFMHCWWS